MGRTLTTGALQALLGRLLERRLPWLRSGLVFDRYARVMEVHTESAESDHLSPRYAVDVQPLTPALGDDETFPAISRVPLGVPGAGLSAGVFALPDKGAIVRLGFMYGLPTHPYVADVFPFGFPVPEVANAVVIRRGGSEIRVDSNGVHISASSVNLGDENGDALVTKSWVQEAFATHSHPQHGVAPTPGVTVPDHYTLKVRAS